MDTVKVVKDVYWVGAIDWNVRDFHGYSTHRGTTYNAYLILGEKNILVDTVKKGFFDEMIGRIQSIIEPRDIDYIFSLHVEMDHSGCLPQIIEVADKAKIVATQRCQKGLSLHYHECKGEFVTVKNGDTLKFGDKTFTFVEIPMLHWPDNTMTYMHEDKILFSSDGFGQHLASSQRFNDEVPEDIVMYEAKKYYANILLRYADIATRRINEILRMNLDIKFIAPAHGIIWCRDPTKIVESYLKWSSGETVKKALVIYDTMWGSTAKMALAIADGIISEGVEVKVFNLRATDRSDVMTEVLDARAIVVGSPTLNNNVFPTVADFLTYMKGFRPKNKIGAAFGSYGWSGEAPKQILEELKAMKFDIMESPLRVQYVPGKEDLEICYKFGKEIGKKIVEE